MLFEAKSRYLLCFLAVWITVSAIGLSACQEWLVQKIEMKIEIVRLIYDGISTN